MENKKAPNLQPNKLNIAVSGEFSEPQCTVDNYKNTIFSLLKDTLGVDFRHYKKSTIHRRIQRRMVINQVDNLKDYTNLLEAHPTEQQALFNDMLIGVTSFFREPQAFNTIKEKILPEIMEKRPLDCPICVWVPGCSTGEEVYSIAITLAEFFENKNIVKKAVQILGTDVNDRNIRRARQGIYPKNIEDSVPEKHHRYFDKINGNYRVNECIRDMCSFSKHDLTKDQPICNVDMVCCRNVLIYFDNALQEKIIPMFFNALKPNGFLILGESESIGKFTDLFEAINKKSSIYIKKRHLVKLTPDKF